MSTEDRGYRRSTSNKPWLRRRRSLHVVRAEQSAVKERAKAEQQNGDSKQQYGTSKHELRELTENRDEKKQVWDACSLFALTEAKKALCERTPSRKSTCQLRELWATYVLGPAVPTC